MRSRVQIVGEKRDLVILLMLIRFGNESRGSASRRHSCRDLNGVLKAEQQRHAGKVSGE